MSRVTEISVTALGDLHVREDDPSEPSWFTALSCSKEQDLVLVAGDITESGLRSEANRAAQWLRRATSAPIIAVLGNHDVASDQDQELVDTLAAHDIKVLLNGWAIVDTRGGPVGVAGAKGFWGGWAGRQITFHGERQMRELNQVLWQEVQTFAHGLSKIDSCPMRIGLLHYSPSESTVRDEPAFVQPALGSSALGKPILEFRPHLVIHGHAHRGSARGRIGTVPVANVALGANGGKPVGFVMTTGATGEIEVRFSDAPSALTEE